MSGKECDGSLQIYIDGKRYLNTGTRTDKAKVTNKYIPSRIPFTQDTKIRFLVEDRDIVYNDVVLDKTVNIADIVKAVKVISLSILFYFKFHRN